MIHKRNRERNKEIKKRRREDSEVERSKAGSDGRMEYTY
jgi:hypothetical protein